LREEEEEEEEEEGQLVQVLSTWQLAGSREVAKT
jgi:hypothetical protein